MGNRLTTISYIYISKTVNSMKTDSLTSRVALIMLLFFLTSAWKVNAQYVESVSWADRVGYTGTNSVQFRTQDATIEGDTVYQIGRVKGFSNFISTDTTNGVYLTHATKQQGFIGAYDHTNQGLIDYQLFESPDDIQMRTVEKIGDYFFVGGTFKDYMYIGSDTLISPHPNNPRTGFIVKLDSSFELVDSYIFSYGNSNYGEWWPSFSVVFNNELYVLVYGQDGNPEHLELVKFDSNLNLIWNRKWTNNDWKQPRGLTVDEHGNLYVAGYIESPIDVDPDTAVTNIFSPYNSNQQYGFLVSVDSSGDYRWHYVLDEGNNNQNDFGLNICYYQGNVIAHGLTNSGGTYLDPNGSSSVTSTAQDNILRINSSNGHLTDFISGMGTVFNPGYVRAINFQVVDDFLYVLTINSGSGYIEPGTGSLYNFSESNSIIKYDSSFNAEVIFEFTGHVDNQWDNMTQFQATSDNGFYFVMNEWDYGTEIKYRDSSGQQQTALSFQSLTYGNFISLRMKLLTGCELPVSPPSATYYQCYGDTLTESLYTDSSGYTVYWYSEAFSDSGTTSFSQPILGDTISKYIAYANSDSCFSQKSRVEFIPRQIDSTIESIEICDSITWLDGNTYYQDTNSVFVSLVNEFSCDSVVELDLTVRNSSFTTNLNQSCDGFVPQLNTYILHDSIIDLSNTSMYGCDSIHQIDHQYFSKVNGTITYDPNNHLAFSNALSDSIYWLLSDLTSASSDTVSVDSSGTYKMILFNSLGCYGDTSYLSIHLDTIPYFDTTTVYNVDTVFYSYTDTLLIDISLIGLNPLAFGHTIKVYPNPASNFLLIESPNSLVSLNCTYEILNSIGQPITNGTLSQNIVSIDLITLNSIGAHQILIKTSSGITLASRILLLQ